MPLSVCEQRSSDGGHLYQEGDALAGERKG